MLTGSDKTFICGTSFPDLPAKKNCRHVAYATRGSSLFIMYSKRCLSDQMRPSASIASATFLKPAMFAPATRS